MIPFHRPLNMDEDKEYMATVSKEIADDIIMGKYRDDPPVTKIVEYDSFYGGVCYGVVYIHDDQDKYQESQYVRNPRIYWEQT